MKYRKVTIILFLSLSLLVACSDFDINKSEIEEIEISFFEDFGKKSKDHYKSIDKRADINTLIDAIKKSKRIKGDVDMPKGDYNLKLKFEDGTEEIFHLWISDKNQTGAIMKIEDTAVLYDLYDPTRKRSERIREILSN